MKKFKKIIIPIIIILIIAGGIAFYLNKLSQDGVLNMADVYATINKLLVYFVPVVILVIAIIVALIIFRNKDKKFKFWLRWESGIALLITILITANVIVFGPMANLFNLQYADLNKVSKETSQKNNELIQQISEEGTVLLKNTDNFLPLEDNSSNLNVFGWSSTQPVYGGTGSGNVDVSSAIDILGSLENAGFKLNNDLTDFYTDYRADRPEVGMWEQDWTLPEPGASDYSDKLIEDAKNFSDTAVVVISRVGGEGADLPTDMKADGITYKGNEGDFKDGEHFLQLSNSEKEMIDMVNNNFENIVVLINSSNAMELGWIEEYANIKGALWMAGPGATGFSALGEILNGTVNPSGRTVDTYVYDLKKTPTWNNFGDFKYSDSDYTYVDYVENIYVGYKFYETFYKNNEESYQSTVQYPFGYGLSYSQFEQSMGEVTLDGNGNISFDVTVKNVGEMAGKDVVEVYYTPPYTNGGIEKAETNLATFSKTEILEPGDTQTVAISFNQEDMASYDSKESGGYVLEKGNYQIQLRADSHTVLDSKDLEIKNTISYGSENKRSSDIVAATNKFTDFAEGEVTYLSRKDNFANYEEATKKPENVKLPDSSKEGLTNSSDYKIENNDDDKMPTVGAKKDVSLDKLKGVDYNDEKWDKLLDQMTIKDMSNIISYGGYQTVKANSVDKLQTYDFDGPQGMSSFFVSTSGTAFPTATMIAATWNKDLAKARGEGVGQEASEIGVSGWYGPAMNIHRSAFSGRNFEYYSEDGLLSGVMAANEVNGAKSKGVYSYIKHFALNDQETNRTNLMLTWSNEQAIREIYLKPFEMAVKDGGATAAMSSFNYIGNQWAGACSELLNDVLRSEWGFNGVVVTDYFGGYGYMQADKAIRNGNDMMLSTTGESGAGLEDTESATGVQAMRNASHNILYTVVNSRAYDNYEPGLNLLTWEKTTIKISVAAGIIILLLQILIIFVYMKRIKKVAKNDE